MFEQLFKRPDCINKHLSAPLLEERIKHIQYYLEQGKSLQALIKMAEYLLRVIEFLHLEIDRVVTYQEIEEAADKWAWIKSRLHSLLKNSPLLTDMGSKFW